MRLSCSTGYHTRPYMAHLPGEIREKYYVEDFGDQEGTQFIDLKNHIGQPRNEAPAFGAPLINYEETETERCNKIIESRYSTGK